MNFFDIPFWQDFISNLLATILGVVIGIPVALWISRLQDKRNEKVKTLKILTVINDELHDDLIYMENWKNNKNKVDEIEILGIELRDEAWRAFSDGGEIAWINDYVLLIELAWSYGSIKNIKSLSEKYFELSTNKTTNVGKASMKRIQDKLEDETYHAIMFIENSLELIKEYI